MAASNQADIELQATSPRLSVINNPLNGTAAGVVVTGDEAFKFLSGNNTPTVNTIILTATVTGALTLVNSSYQWQYYNTGTSQWTNLGVPSSGVVTNSVATYSLDYNNSAFTGDTIRIRCLISATVSGNSYTYNSEITIAKIRDGAAGSDGYSYWFTGATALQRNAAGTVYTPSSITFTGYRSIGANSPAAYSGRWVVDTDTGSGYSNNAISGNDSSTFTYTPSGSTVKSVRVRLYSSGGTTLLDEEILPVVVDGTSATTIDLSNDAVTIATANDGTGGVYTNATTTVRVYVGSVDDTSNWTLGKTDSNTVSSFGTGASANVLSVTNLTADNGSVTITATKGTSTLTAVFSLSKSKTGAQGTAALTGYLTNESHTIPADNAGVVQASDYTAAGGFFKVFFGTTDVTSLSTFAVSAGTGTVTVSTPNSTTGAYSVSGLTTDSATVNLTATYNNVTITKVYSISKSKTGGAGSNAQTLNLSASSQTFKYDQLGVPSPIVQTITFTVFTQNTTGTPTYGIVGYDANNTSYTIVASGTTVSGGTFTLTNTQFLTNANIISAVATVTLGSLTDRVTVVKTSDGAAGYTMSLTNSALALNAASDGTVTIDASNNTHANTQAQVYYNGVDDSANWSFFVSAIGSNVTYRDADDGSTRTGTGKTAGTIGGTNLLTNSNTLSTPSGGDNAIWTVSQIDAPDGTVNAAGRLTPDTTNSTTHQGKFSANYTINTTYTLTGYIKQSGTTYNTLVGRAASVIGSVGGWIYDFSTGTGNGATFTRLQNGWVRFAVTFTATATTASNYWFWINGSYTGGTNYGVATTAFAGAANTTEGFYIWGLQLETGSTATGLTQTAGTAASGTPRGYLSVSSLAQDASYIDITAYRPGYGSLLQRLNVTRTRAGAAGSNGTRTAVLDLYQWASSAPTTYPSGTSTYTWSTGQFTTNTTTLNGWTTVPGTPTAGQTLYIVRQVYSDTNTAASTVITWNVNSSNVITVSKAGDNGSPGANGYRYGVLEVYQWSATTPTVYPSGTSTYTWSTGQFTAPSTANGWSVTPGASVAGQTLWGIQVILSDQQITAQSTATWNSSTVYPVGYAGSNGVNAKALTITSNIQSFTYDGTGSLLPSSQTATLTLNPQNLTGSPNLTYIRYNSSGTPLETAQPLTVTNNQATFSANTFSTSAQYVIFTAQQDGVTANFSIIRVQNGSNGTSITGPTGPRNASGLIYWNTSQNSAPTAPTGSGFNFDSASFTTVTSGWTTTFSIPDLTGNTTNLKYWASRYTVSEATFGGTQTVAFSTPFTWTNFDGLVTFTNLAAGKDASGTVSSTLIDGASIKTGSITTNSLTVGGFSDSAILNASFEDVSTTDSTLPTKWVRGTGIITNYHTRGSDSTYLRRDTSDSYSGSASILFNGSGQAVSLYSELIPVAADDKWYLSIRVKSTSTTVPATQIFARIIKEGTGMTDDSSNQVNVGIEGVTAPTNTWELFTGQGTIPAGWKNARVMVLQWTAGNSQAFRLDEVEFKKATGSANISELNATKITAGTITVDKLNFNTIGKNVILNSGATADVWGWSTADAIASNTNAWIKSVPSWVNVWHIAPYGGYARGWPGTFYANNTVLGWVGMANENNNGNLVVNPGDRVELSVYVSSHRCRSTLQLGLYNAANEYLTEITIGTNNNNYPASGGRLQDWAGARLGGFYNIPSDGLITSATTTDKKVNHCKWWVYAYGTGQTGETVGPYQFVCLPFLAKASPNQTTLTAWSESTPSIYTDIISPNAITQGSKYEFNGTTTNYTVPLNGTLYFGNQVITSSFIHTNGNNPVLLTGAVSIELKSNFTDQGYAEGHYYITYRRWIVTNGVGNWDTVDTLLYAAYPHLRFAVSSDGTNFYSVSSGVFPIIGRSNLDGISGALYQFRINFGMGLFVNSGGRPAASGTWRISTATNVQEFKK